MNAVIANLNAPEEKTIAAEKFANDKNTATEVQAYAKIAGNNWTYYVKALNVTIGRNEETVEHPDGSTTGTDIVLGPSKLVSRSHASINYNLNTRSWELYVTGRNGAKVNTVKVPCGANAVPTELNSGAVLDIGGTQMMFILPDAQPIVSRAILDQVAPKLPPPKSKRMALDVSVTANPVPGSSTFNNNSTSFNNRGTKGLSGPMKAFQMFENNDNKSPQHSPSVENDLSTDEARDIKPPYSYATMITQAILSNTEGVLSLSEIYDWIASHYAFYRFSKSGWQNSIRHNLSLNKAFEKVPRRPNEPGKGMKWQISDAYRDEFMKKFQSGSLSKARRGSSVSRQLQLHLITHNDLPASQSQRRKVIQQHYPNAPPEYQQPLNPEQQQQQQQQQQVQQVQHPHPQAHLQSNESLQYINATHAAQTTKPPHFNGPPHNPYVNMYVQQLPPLQQQQQQQQQGPPVAYQQTLYPQSRDSSIVSGTGSPPPGYHPLPHTQHTLPPQQQQVLGLGQMHQQPKQQQVQQQPQLHQNHVLVQQQMHHNVQSIGNKRKKELKDGQPGTQPLSEGSVISSSSQTKPSKLSTDTTEVKPSTRDDSAPQTQLSSPVKNPATFQSNGVTSGDGAISGAKDGQLSTDYGMIASPNKPFSISAVEAYTPERGARKKDSGEPGQPGALQSSPALWNFVQFSTPLQPGQGKDSASPLKNGFQNVPDSPLTSKNKVQQRQPLTSQQEQQYQQQHDNETHTSDLQNVDLAKGFKK